MDAFEIRADLCKCVNNELRHGKLLIISIITAAIAFVVY